MDSSMMTLVLAAAGISIALSFWLVSERTKNLTLLNDLEQASFAKLRQQEET